MLEAFIKKAQKNNLVTFEQKMSLLYEWVQKNVIDLDEFIRIAGHLGM